MCCARAHTCKLTVVPIQACAVPPWTSSSPNLLYDRPPRSSPADETCRVYSSGSKQELQIKVVPLQQQRAADPLIMTASCSGWKNIQDSKCDIPQDRHTHVHADAALTDTRDLTLWIVQTFGEKPRGLLKERIGDMAASFIEVVLNEVCDAQSCPFVVVWVCLKIPRGQAERRCCAVKRALHDSHFQQPHKKREAGSRT